MAPTWTSICPNICEGRPLLRGLLEEGRLNPTLTLGRAVGGSSGTGVRRPPPKVSGPPIFSLVVLRTIKVIPATRPTVMGEVRACSS